MVRKTVEGALVLLSGAVLLKVVLTGIFNYYVSESMKYPLLLAGAFLVFLGLWLTWQANFSKDEEDEHKIPKSAYALLLPVLAILLISPTPLGAYTASRDGNNTAAPDAQTLSELDENTGPIMTLSEYVINAVWNNGRNLKYRNVDLTGFVTKDPQGGWWVSRVSITCCAGDAKVTKVKVLNAGEYENNTWVKVTGHWVPGGGLKKNSAIPNIRADKVEVIPEPEQPYENGL